MAESCCNSKAAASGKGPLAWFDRMIEHCHEYAKAEKAAGRPVVGIMCEYTPRELIMAAGAVPVCLCGGSAKTIPAAEQHLPANLCPLIKSTYGYHVQRNNPFLEMADLVVGETTCDGKKKMYELMAESRPMYVLELPHKSGDAEALQYWIGELREFRDFLSKRFNTEITDERIRQSIGMLNRERALRRELAGLMKSDRPPLTGRQLLDCKSSIWAMPEALQQYKLAIEAFRGQCEKTSSKNECESPAAKENNRVRVQMTGVPMVHGAERVIDIVENCGGTVVAMENCTGLKPLLDDVDENATDPLRGRGRKVLPSALLGHDPQRPPPGSPGQTGGRLSARMHHRADMAGLPHLRRGIASDQTFRRRAIGIALSSHRNRLLALRLRPHRYPRGSVV